MAIAGKKFAKYCMFRMWYYKILLKIVGIYRSYWHKFNDHFLPGDAMLVQYVLLSCVCLSVCHMLVLCQNV